MLPVCEVARAVDELDVLVWDVGVVEGSER